MTGRELKDLMSLSPPKGQRCFYDEYKNYVYTIVYSKLADCGTKQDIEECVCDVFADIFLNIERFYEIDELSGMTGLIAKRKAIKVFHRLTDKYIACDELDESIPDGCDLASETEKPEIARILFDKITKLGEPDSSIILMSYYYEMNSVQISRRLSLAPAFVRKRKQRALRKLRKLLSGSNIF